MATTITITSGKGGVGKSNVCLNMAIELARLGHSTCLFDADLGMANINILLGLRPEYDIRDVTHGTKSLDEIILRNMHGIDILPGSSGVEEMANLDQSQLDNLLSSFASIPDYDFLLFDTAAGISKHVISFCLAANEVVLVITHEPTSLTDAYALLKVLVANGFTGKARVVVNRCTSTPQARTTFKTFRQAVATHLHREVIALGLIFEDPKVMDAIHRQEPYIHCFPDSKGAKCFNMIASRLVDDSISEDFDHDLSSFWGRCLKSMTGFLKIPNLNPKGAQGQRENGMAIPAEQDLATAGTIVAEIRLLRQAVELVAERLAAGEQGKGAEAGEGTTKKLVPGPPLKLDLASFIMQTRKGSGKNQ